MEGKFLISVVIPTYNRAHSIQKTINSVLNQTYTNFEIIIIDDASTDTTENVVGNITDKRVKYYKLENNTKGTRPRNYGIELSKGEFIAFLDSDDYWLPDKLEKQLKFICSQKSEAIMCFTDLIVKEDLIEKRVLNQLYQDDMDIMEYIFVHRNVVQTSTYMVDSKTAKAVMFSPTLQKHQDWDFCLRLREYGCKFIHLNETLSVWVTDSRPDRISLDSNVNKSEAWIHSNQKSISNKTYWGFQSYVLVPSLVRKGLKGKAVIILYKSFINGGITLGVLIKELLKLTLREEIWTRLRISILKYKKIIVHSRRERK